MSKGLDKKKETKKKPTKTIKESARREREEGEEGFARPDRAHSRLALFADRASLRSSSVGAMGGLEPPTQHYECCALTG